MKLSALAFLAMTFGSSPAFAAEGPEAVLASHRLQGLDGDPLTLDALRGEVLVVNFWATWCKPCKRELKDLALLHERIASQGGRVIAVSVDRDPANVARYLEQNGLALPVYVDGPDGLARALELETVPTTYVLDRNGALAYAASGTSSWQAVVAAADQALREDSGVAGKEKP